MNWTVNGQEYPILRLASLLGIMSGSIAIALGLLFEQAFLTILYLGVASGAAGFLACTAMFLADLALNAKAEGEAKRAKLRAAKRIYQAWATGELEPPAELHTATLRVNGEERKLEWLRDDDPNTARWRELLVALFQYARAYHRETRGARTGLTEADMVGDSAMFSGREAYLAAIKQARELGLVERTNGLPTKMADGWTYQKAISYLQTSAILPTIRERAPFHRAYSGIKP